jgi:hypothetical protein
MTVASLPHRVRSARRFRPFQPAPQPALSAQLVWPQRHRNEAWRHTGQHRVWLTRCRRYRISRCTEHAGRPFLACLLLWRGSEYSAWDLISRHRTLAAAQRVCELHAQSQQQQHVPRIRA